MEDIQAFEQYKQRLARLELFVKPDQAEEFCNKHGLQLRMLDNGMKFIAAQKISQDDRTSSINVSILSGSYMDPKGKEGLHHFLEHLLFSRDLSYVFSNHRAYVNAYTNKSTTKLVTSGLLNLEYPETGLTNVLPTCLETITNPYGLRDDSIIESNKNVINSEIQEDRNNSGNLIKEAFYSYFLPSDHPILHHTLGTSKSIAAIEKEDLAKLMEQIYVARNMIVSMFAVGEGGEAAYLLDKVTELFKDFPRVGEKTLYNPFTHYELKPIPTNKVIKIPTGIPGDIVDVMVGWVLELEPYSAEDLVLDQFLIDRMRLEFFNCVREDGLSYSCNVFVDKFLPNKILIGFSTVVQKSIYKQAVEDLNRSVDRMLESVLKDKQGLEDLLQSEHDFQRATPIAQEAKLNTCLGSLIDFDLLWDFEREMQLRLEAKVEDMISILETMRNQKRFSMVLGDFFSIKKIWQDTRRK
jgi:predicted Zn-dependent peptidase